ncbi:MAG: hypothetical protein OXG64_06415 [Chloroflexi bacterium]|nr:hypothetical protein [Chloroflexota bacterium]
MIACAVPLAGCGNSFPILIPTSDCAEAVHAYRDAAHSVLANLNALAFDFTARQKLQGQNLNLFVVEQLPIIPLKVYHRRFGDRIAADQVRDHVLRLTYTAHDMAAFARDLGHHGPPFPWDEEQRRHLRARLDACYFHLYGLDRDNARYILSTFPMIQRQDEDQFGTFRTRDLILAYMNALAAGDTRTDVAA